MVAEAEEQGEPLSTLFNSAPPQKNTRKSYNAIAARLCPDYAKPVNSQKALLFGNVDYVERHPMKLVDDDSLKMAINAAHLGHTDLCRYFIAQTDNPKTATARIIREAFSYGQHHIVDALIPPDNKDNVTANLGFAHDTDKRSEYRAFERMVRDFQRSTPDIDPALMTGLESWQHVPLKLGSYRGIRAILKNEIPNIKTLNQYTFRAALLFQTDERLLRFFDRWGKKGDTPLLSLLERLVDMPISKHVDWPSWGDAALKYGSAIFFPLQFAQQLKTPCRNERGAISLHLTRQKVWENYKVHDPEYRRIGELCYELQTKVSIVEKAIDLWRRASRFMPPPSETIPAISLDGASFGMNGYKLEKIPYEDPRIMFLGYYTGCCEKIGDHFEDTVEHALTTRTSGFYVLTKDNEIRAHSWAWRGEHGQLIIDGWESKDPAVNAQNLVRLTRTMGQEFSAPAYEEHAITDVLLGVSNDDLKVEKYFQKADYPAKRFVVEWYYPDYSNENPDYYQWHVHRVKPPQLAVSSHPTRNPKSYDF